MKMFIIMKSGRRYIVPASSEEEAEAKLESLEEGEDAESV